MDYMDQYIIIWINQYNLMIYIYNDLYNTMMIIISTVFDDL